MKAAFREIEQKLENPIFENNCLSKKAIQQRILRLEQFTDIPDIFQFIEWTKKDNDETIFYSFADTAIGQLLIANTSKGICFLGFANEGKPVVLDDFKRRFPHSDFTEQLTGMQQTAMDYCNGNREQTIPLHLKGTNFQMDIWKKLVRIPEGGLSTYGSLIPGSKGARAIGSAVGANPVSYIIPCHRIVRNDGSFRGYHWGTRLKRLLLAYESQDV